MSISLNNHEQRITVLENISKRFDFEIILNSKTNITPTTLLKYDFSKWKDWDFVYVAFDAWGVTENFDYQVVDEGLIPIGLIKNMWCQRIQMYESGYMQHEGVEFYLGSDNMLQVKYVGREGFGAIWKIIALKI